MFQGEENWGAQETGEDESAEELAPPPATCCPHSRFRAGATVAHGQRNLGSRRHSGNGHVGTDASNVACWPRHYQHDMPKTGGGRFRGMNCATSKTRHLAPTFASHGFQRKQANVDCQKWMGQFGKVTLSTELYSPRFKTDSHIHRESIGQAGGTSQGNYPVEGSSPGAVGGWAARTHIVLFNTRTRSRPPPGGEHPDRALMGCRRGRWKD